MIKYSSHDPVDVTRENSTDIGDGFTFSEADLIGREIKSISSEMSHTHIKGDPGSKARFLEDHCEYLTGEQRFIPSALPFNFQTRGESEQLV
jgi:hypothetical protein